MRAYTMTNVRVLDSCIQTVYGSSKEPLHENDNYVNYSLNSVKGVYIGDCNIGTYYRGY